MAASGAKSSAFSPAIPSANALISASTSGGGGDFDSSASTASRLARASMPSTVASTRARVFSCAMIRVSVMNEALPPTWS